MNRRREQLWSDLQQAGVVQGDIPELQELESPWYVKVILAFSGWLAALFLLGFIGIGFEFIIDNSAASLLIGAVMTGTAFALLRSANSEFIEHLSLAISLAGQALLSWAIFNFTQQENAIAWCLLAVLQAFLAAVMPNFVHRVFSSFVAAYALSVSLAYLQVPYLFSSLLLFFVAWLWLNEFRYPQQAQKIRAVGYGLVLASIFLKGSSVIASHQLFWGRSQLLNEHWVQPWMAEIIMAAVMLYIVRELLRRAGQALNSRLGLTAMAAILLLSLCSMQAPGISLGMMIVLIGFAGGNRILLGLGIASLLSYISSYYYLLDATLLSKSGILLSVGLLLLCIRWSLLRLLAAEQEGNHG